MLWRLSLHIKMNKGAGITRDNLFMRMSDEEWASVLDVNLTSTMRLCKGAIRGMMPGFITTAMTDKLSDDQKSGILTQVPAGRMGDADEIASAVVYLASQEAGYITGTTLHVNGGMAMY